MPRRYPQRIEAVTLPLATPPRCAPRRSFLDGASLARNVLRGSDRTGVQGCCLSRRRQSVRDCVTRLAEQDLIPIRFALLDQLHYRGRGFPET